MLWKINRERQAVVNRSAFERLPVGAGFCLYGLGRSSLYVHERYCKLGENSVQASDGRRWSVSDTAILSGGSLLVPDGSRSFGECLG